METFYCNECGEPFQIDGNGVSYHIDESGEIDYDADADHIAYGETPFP